jgi:type VI secretion system protein VasJ
LAPAVASAVPPVDPEQILSALREAARSNALALLQADLCEPRAYALLRAVTWLAVTDPPPASQGRTAILPPTDQRQAEFTALRDAGDPAQLVLALERYCSGSGIFWLDGHRLAAAALGELGARYHGCVAAIIHGLAALIARLPALPALAFSDGQPFADAATRAWIETVVTPRPSSAAANTEQDPWKAGLSEAQALLLGGKAEAGLAGLVTAGRSAPSGRARFFWGLAQARLCIQAGASPVALPVLQHLDRLVEQHGLEDWEPAVVIETVQLLHDCLASPELAQVIPQADRAACAAAAFARLARLDPVQATRTAKLFRLTEEKDLKRGQ